MTAIRPYVRLNERDVNQKHYKSSHTSQSGKKYSAGPWQQVSMAEALELSKVTQIPYDSNSEKAFTLCASKADSLALIERELAAKRTKQSKAAGGALSGREMLERARNPLNFPDEVEEPDPAIFTAPDGRIMTSNEAEDRIEKSKKPRKKPGPKPGSKKTASPKSDPKTASPKSDPNPKS